MERELLRLSETPLHLEKTWESGGVPVLTAEVTLPCCGGKSRRARRFDRYYRQYARAYLKYCLQAPSAESPSTMYSSRRSTSLVRQSTNFWTRLAMSIFSVSFFF